MGKPVLLTVQAFPFLIILSAEIQGFQPLYGVCKPLPNYSTTCRS